MPDVRIIALIFMLFIAFRSADGTNETLVDAGEVISLTFCQPKDQLTYWKKSTSARTAAQVRGYSDWE